MWEDEGLSFEADRTDSSESAAPATREGTCYPRDETFAVEVACDVTKDGSANAVVVGGTVSVTINYPKVTSSEVFKCVGGVLCFNTGTEVNVTAGGMTVAVEGKFSGKLDIAKASKLLRKRAVFGRFFMAGLLPVQIYSFVTPHVDFSAGDLTINYEHFTPLSLAFEDSWSDAELSARARNTYSRPDKFTVKGAVQGTAGLEYEFGLATPGNQEWLCRSLPWTPSEI